MLSKIFPKNNIVMIKYFTAKVHERNDPDRPNRQMRFIRALETIPNLSIYYGHFLEKPVTMPDAADPMIRRRVIKTEEKGSDVNLAVQLLNDAYKNLFETAIVVSNDSDLAGAIQIVRNELKKTVGFLNPHRRPSVTLKQACTFVRQIREGVLKDSQFPDVVITRDGEKIHKPSVWNDP